MSSETMLASGAKGWLVLGFTIAIFSILIGNLQSNASLTTTGNTTLANIDTGLGQFGTFAGIAILMIIFVYLLAKVNQVKTGD